MDPLEVFLPSGNIKAWRSALPGHNDELLEKLVFMEPPDVVHLAIMSYINNLYLTGMNRSDLVAEVGRAYRQLEAVRRSLGPQLREIDLGLMRLIHRSGTLSVVIGAGATMAAGGPSWAGLVERMLITALGRGHERNPGVARFDPSAERKAREVLTLIEGGKADGQMLMLGAQLCYDLFGQHLFTQLHGVLYQNNRQPSEIHRAVADLAYWGCIVTYNYDDLMGEAIDAKHLARAAFAMRGDKMAGDPNALAQKVGQDGVYQKIFHLHGYTPRRGFNITNVKFVLAASQYQAPYPRTNEILNHVYENYLAKPIHHALYIGCSFEDDAMNDLLRDAWEWCPGRWHYAMLKWPGQKRYRQSNAKEISDASSKHKKIGVQPVWFDRFDEIPGMIRKLR